MSPPSFSAPLAPRGKSGRRIQRNSAFTLLELLLVVAIIAILASLLMPSMATMKQKADSIACSSNLRTIGAAVQLYLQDHNQNFPTINPAVPPLVYDPSTPGVTTMIAAFGPYGVTQTTLQCPSDMKQGSSSSYAQYQNSYDWKPTLDDESTTEPLIYGGAFGRRAQFGAQASGSNGATGFVVKLSKVRQCFDDTQIHFGHMNALYADGHVVYFSAPNAAVR